jgi:hypothetical protein
MIWTAIFENTNASDSYSGGLLVFAIIVNQFVDVWEAKCEVYDAGDISRINCLHPVFSNNHMKGSLFFTELCDCFHGNSLY